MKGMILAAGEGRRLRPLTDRLPKPMLPLAGRPLLEHIIVHLHHCGLTDLAVNLYHLPATVMDYFGDGQRWGINLRYSVEERLLGSAGGVKRLEPFFDQTFVVYYGDVLTWADLRPMIEFHRQASVLATLGLYEVPDPWNRGIVDLDPQGLIVRFAEKPPREQVFSNLANAGIYVLEPAVLARIPADQPYDFGHDVFPRMLADGLPLAGYVLQDFLIDIGLPEKYEEANRIVSAIEPEPNCLGDLATRSLQPKAVYSSFHRPPQDQITLGPLLRLISFIRSRFEPICSVLPPHFSPSSLSIVINTDVG